MYKKKFLAMLPNQNMQYKFGGGQAGVTVICMGCGQDANPQPLAWKARTLTTTPSRYLNIETATL